MTEREIYDYLQGKEIFCEIGSMQLKGATLILVEIECGDWKHDHEYCDYLMGEIGYTCVQEDVTNEDGSDCYSSIHVYSKQ